MDFVISVGVELAPDLATVGPADFAAGLEVHFGAQLSLLKTELAIQPVKPAVGLPGSAKFAGMAIAVEVD